MVTSRRLEPVWLLTLRLVVVAVRRLVDAAAATRPAAAPATPPSSPPAVAIGVVGPVQPAATVLEARRLTTGTRVTASKSASAPGSGLPTGSGQSHRRPSTMAPVPRPRLSAPTEMLLIGFRGVGSGSDALLDRAKNATVSREPVGDDGNHGHIFLRWAFDAARRPTSQGCTTAGAPALPLLFSSL